MGVVNVTPDSFSDGGRWFDTTAAIKHGLDLVAEGADLVDVGGESTRPGASRVDESEELRRVVPVVRELAREGVTISVDTMRARVAEQAVAAGATLVNDVSGGLADPDMIPVVAASGTPFVVMHWRGFSESMNSRAVYEDVVAEVVAELRMRMDAVVAGGVAPERIVVDPGLGFAKDAARPRPRRPPRRAARPRPSAAGRRLPQAVPRPCAGPRGRRPAARPRTRRGHRRDLRPVRPGGRLGGQGPRGPGHRRRRTGRPRRRGSRVSERHDDQAEAAADIAAVEQANTAFYEAMERGDLDELSGLWLPGEDLTISCVHPGWPVLSGRGEVLRSYALIMANTEYIQFFLTDVGVSMTGDTALVTCTENILSGGPAEDGGELGPLVGQLVVATNVFRRTVDGWKLWSHHGSPVLADSDDDDDEDTPS